MKLLVAIQKITGILKELRNFLKHTSQGDGMLHMPTRLGGYPLFTKTIHWPLDFPKHMSQGDGMIRMPTHL